MQILSITRRRTEQFSDAQFEPLLEPEAERIRALYAAGSVRECWSRQDVPGAVTMIEADSLEDARALVESFPLVQRGMLEIQQLIPLRGYRGFGPRS
ncbi:MAG TPA: hypothetical protein VFA29_15310 [Candidatus Baltobacteraceae bacterium]|nr:hypothetical protein [Candidatus Baltobacteraceae bacterium]